MHSVPKTAVSWAGTAHALTTSAKDNAEAAVFELKAEVETLDAKALAEEAVQKKLRNTIQELKGNIRVFCRVRPMLAADTTSDSEPVQVFDLGADKKAIQVQNPEGRSNAMGESKTEVKHFAFDHVFGESSTQDEVFGEVGQLVQSAVDGYKVCVFCYGQTGSGKTFTMQGPEVSLCGFSIH
jgi:kinesin family protein C1